MRHNEEPLTVLEMDWGQKQAVDPIMLVQNHLEKILGKTEAAQKLQSMSGLEVLNMAEDLKNDRSVNLEKNGEIPLTIPEMKFS